MNILLLLPTAPDDLSTGGGQRGAFMFDALSTGHTVDVGVIRQGPQDRIALPKVGPVRFTAEWRPRLGEFGNVVADENISRVVADTMAGRRYDLVVSRFMMPLIKAGIDADIPTIADVDDCRMRFSSGGNAAYGLRQIPWRIRARVIESVIRPRMSSRFHYFFVTTRDRQEFKRLSGSILPNIPLLPLVAQSTASSGEQLLFVAALGYGPNVRGIDRFIKSSWPRIRQQRPHARLRLVGRAPQRLQERWGQVSGVDVAGFVPELKQEYESSAFSICPIYEGCGSNIKILESFAFGRTCVTTNHCASAFDEHLDSRTDIRSAGTDREFSDACIELLADRAQRDARASFGQEIVRSQFTKTRFAEVVNEAVSAALRIAGT